MFLQEHSRNRQLAILSGLVKPIAYNDSAIQYLGRWNDTGTGKWSAWGGAVALFKVSGTTRLKVLLDVVDINTTDSNFITYHLDDTSASRTQVSVTSAAQIYSGKAYVEITIPDTATHSVMICAGGLLAGMFAVSSQLTILGYEIDAEGLVTSWTQGSKLLQLVGDSWMGNREDWPRLLDRTKWKLYPNATGGETCSGLNSRYNYQYSTTSATSDPAPVGVIISCGANDYGGGVTVASFQASLFSLFDKVRAMQPSAPIIMVRQPSNTAAGLLFGQYGTAMAAVAAARSSAYYCDTSSLDASMGWLDAYHLNAASRVTLATFVDSYLTTLGI